MNEKRQKLVIIGASGVGKSALYVQYDQGIFVERYDPTIESTYFKYQEVDGTTCVLELYDVNNTEYKSAMRDYYLKIADGFLLVYSITSLSSFCDLPDYINEIREVKKDVPLVIVGNKVDLESERIVTSSQGEEFANKHNASFFETSAKTKINVDTAFIQLCRNILADEPEEKLRKQKQAEREAMKPKVPPPIPIPPIPASCYLSDLQSILKSGDLADFVFVVEGRELKIHKAIVLCICPVLHDQILKSERMELKNVSYETMFDVMNFVYTGRIENLNEDKAENIHKFAMEYTMFSLMAAMESFKQLKSVAFDTFIPSLSPLFDSDLLSDVNITLENGKVIRAHKCILGARSPYLLRMFKSGFAESQKAVNIMLKEASQEAVLFLLQHIYTDITNLEDVSEHVLDVLELAHRFEITRLLSVCECLLIESLHLNNVLSLITCSETYQLINLYNACIEYCSYRLDKIISTTEFKKLTINLQNIITSKKKERKLDYFIKSIKCFY